MEIPRPPVPIAFVTSKHPYVVEGDKDPIHTEQNAGEAYYLRVDLPGICKETLRVWADKDFVYFEVEDAKNDEKYDKDPPRKYKGRISPFQRSHYKIDKLKYVVKDGVLKLMIPSSDD